MLVDNAIVVLENINRRINEVPSGRGLTSSRSMEGRRAVAECAEVGTREVARAVIAATLTTVAVFFPVVYVPGIAGAFFRDQALTVTFSLLVSVVVALLLQPMLSARVLRVSIGGPRGLFKEFDRGFEAFHRRYHSALVRALRRPGRMVTALSVGLAVSWTLGLRIDRGFMPERASGDMRVDVELPAGTPLEETTAIAGALAAWVEKEAGVKHVFTQVATTERTLAAMQDYTAPNTARIRIIMAPGRSAHETSERLQERIAERLEATPELRYAFREEGVGLAEILSTGESPFTMGVIADDPIEAVNTAERILSELRKSRYLADLQIDRVIGTTNVVVHLDAEEILRAGLDPDVIARELRNRIAGVEATTFNEVEKRIDIAVRFPRDERRNLASVLDSPVELAGGESIPIRNFLDVSEERPVRELSRSDQRRMVTISGDLGDGTIEDAWADANAAVARLDLPSHVKVVEGGERAEMESSFRDLLWAMVLAVVLVYMILAAQFESFVDPLLIAMILPIGISGAFIAIAVTGNTLNILSLIGMVALVGIAVNDSIIKVDAIRRLRDEGMDGYAAILAASRLRLRPIIMTSATTILAMVPMAIGLGSGEQLQRPLAVTIIGGLTVTTALTLFYTPVLYKLAHGIRGDEA
jgi:HAE1 family hydrophobic/amphiphilic exporter-1